MTNRATVVISGRGRHGEGIASHQGKDIYVPQALLGETLEVAIGAPFAPNSKRCPGTILKIITPSPYRVTPEEQARACPHYARCGGCQLTHVSPEGQLAYKRADIVAALSAVVAPKQADLLVRPVVPTTQRPCRFKSIRYAAPRNPNRLSPLALGFYAAGSHDLVPVTKCPLEPERFGVVAAALEQALNELALPCYDEAQAAATQGTKRAAAVRALQLRLGDDNAVSACLIMAGRLNEAQRSTLRATAHAMGLESLTVGYNDQVGNALFTRDLELIAGSAAISKTLLGARFAVYPNTFLQVNYEICTKLYQAAIEHCAKAQTQQRALDLCCGVGTMTLALAQHFEQVLGVEIVADAIAAAQANAQANGLSARCDFRAADITQVLPKLIYEQKQARKLGRDEQLISAIIADPARVGLGVANAQLLAQIPGPCQLALIFCALPALKRDLPPLLQGGFSIDYVQGFDMFPGSQHVETLVCLSKAR